MAARVALSSDWRQNRAMTKNIAILMFPGSQSLDITGPMEVFALASRQALDDEPGGAPLYALRFLARRAGPVPMASGMQVLADHGCADGQDGVDTLLVSGGMGDALERVRAESDTLDWLRAMVGRVRRMGSICSGALLLAEAGILDGRQATTHWLDVPEMRARYPQVRLVADAIYVHDGMLWTSAGITAGMDLALAMVAADHGLPLALKVAKRMVLATKRSGGQTQFSENLAALAMWLAANRRRRIDVDDMADHVHMSPRNFRRRFLNAFGNTPQKYLEGLRIEAAKPLLEHSQRDLKQIADEAGFASAEAMRRAFTRQLGCGPLDYRARMAAPG